MKKLIWMFLVLLVMPLPAMAGKLADLEDILKPTAFCVQGGKLYVMDQWEVKILSLKDFKLIGKVGLRGEGPGQILLKSTFKVKGDTIVVHSMNQIIVFSLLFKKVFRFCFDVSNVVRTYRLCSKVFDSKQPSLCF